MTKNVLAMLVLGVRSLLSVCLKTLSYYSQLPLLIWVFGKLPQVCLWSAGPRLSAPMSPLSGSPPSDALAEDKTREILPCESVSILVWKTPSQDCSGSCFLDLCLFSISWPTTVWNSAGVCTLLAFVFFFPSVLKKKKKNPTEFYFKPIQMTGAQSWECFGNQQKKILLHSALFPHTSYCWGYCIFQDSCAFLRPVPCTPEKQLVMKLILT